MIDTSMLEEVLLAYLRTSKQVILKDCKIEELQNKSIYTIQLSVDKEFGNTLIKPLNQFFEFFKSKDEKNK